MTNQDDAVFLSDFLSASRTAMQTYADDPAHRQTLVAFADTIMQAFARGGKLMLAGNGGSAGDAQHIACEFVTRLYFERAPLPVIALSTDSSVLTAASNDYGFEHIFERQVLALGREGDVLLGLSTSGKSPNILRAFATAKQKNIVTLGFAGETQGPMDDICGLTLHVPAPRNFLVQQLHITAAHAICGLIEQRLFGRSGG